AVKFGSTCAGDSGGPLFAQSGGINYLVGVTSAGNQSCLPGGRDYDLDVYQFREWILNVTQAFPPPVNVTVYRNPRQIGCGFYQATDQNKQFLIVDRPETKRVRVTLNCTPTVKPLSFSVVPIDGKAKSCLAPEQPPKTMAAACEVDMSESKAWNVIYRSDGIPDCQVVATAFD
ncbi:MAG: trypsin-like serine protease, partial [Rhodomicrobium sp.]